MKSGYETVEMVAGPHDGERFSVPSGMPLLRLAGPDTTTMPTSRDPVHVYQRTAARSWRDQTVRYLYLGIET